MSISRLYRYCVAALLILGSTNFLLTGNLRAQANPSVHIEGTHGSELGGFENIGCDLRPGIDSNATVATFNLLITYDTAGLELYDITPGYALSTNMWDFFDWSVGSDADCGGVPCPDSIISITASVGDTGLPINTAGGSVELFHLYFKTTSDTANYACMFAPVRFIWFDCGDNLITSDLFSDTAYASDAISLLDLSGDDSQDAPFPTVYGAPSTCIPAGIPGKTLVRKFDFFSGGVDFLCMDSIDDRGDINLNGQAYEVADWVLFANFFAYGPDVFPESLDYDATDVNADGLYLRLDDLVFLHAVIEGQYLPYPRPGFQTDTAVIRQDHPNRTVSIDYPGDLRAAYLVFGGNLGIADELYDSTVTRYIEISDYMSWDSTIAETLITAYTGDAPLIYAEVSSDGINSIPVRLDLIDVPPCCDSRGDVNGRGGINISDLTVLVSHLFGLSDSDYPDGSLPPLTFIPCLDEADVNGSSGINVSDLTYLVDHIFRSGPAPPPCP